MCDKPKVEFSEKKMKVASSLAKNVKYWIFQTNEKIFDIFAVTHLKIDKWSIRQFKNEITKGDKAIIWIARGGPLSGAYATIEIINGPFCEKIGPEESKYWKNKKEMNKTDKRVEYKYLKKFFNKPIYIESCKNDPILKDLKILSFWRGTNFPMSLKHWNRINELR